MARRHTILVHVHIEYGDGPFDRDTIKGFDITAAPQLICGCCGDRVRLPAQIVGRVQNGKYQAGRVLVYEMLCKKGTKSRLNARMRRKIARDAQHRSGLYLQFSQPLAG